MSISHFSILYFNQFYIYFSSPVMDLEEEENVDAVINYVKLENPQLVDFRV